jgi:hypothetical protein
MTQLEDRSAEDLDVRIYPAAPDRFDPVTATDADLAAYGYPRRPDPEQRTRAYATWRRAVSGARPIVPRFAAGPGRYPAVTTPPGWNPPGQLPPEPSPVPGPPLHRRPRADEATRPIVRRRREGTLEGVTRAEGPILSRRRPAAPAPVARNPGVLRLVVLPFSSEPAVMLSRGGAGIAGRHGWASG